MLVPASGFVSAFGVSTLVLILAKEESVSISCSVKVFLEEEEEEEEEEVVEREEEEEGLVSLRKEEEEERLSDADAVLSLLVVLDFWEILVSTLVPTTLKFPFEVEESVVAAVVSKEEVEGEGEGVEGASVGEIV